MAASRAPVAIDSTAQGSSLLTADSLEPQAMVSELAPSQPTQEQQVNGCLYSLQAGAAQKMCGVFWLRCFDLRQTLSQKCQEL